MQAEVHERGKQVPRRGREAAAILHAIVAMSLRRGLCRQPWSLHEALTELPVFLLVGFGTRGGMLDI